MNDSRHARSLKRGKKRQIQKISCVARPHEIRCGVSTGIRTPVPTVKGSCPRPLDDGDLSNCGGGKRIRTADPLHAMQVLYQLSYTPEREEAFYRLFS